MKFRNAFYLGWASLRAHFGRSLLLMGVIGILFCLIFVAQFWFQGLENQYLVSAGQKSGGKVVLFANDVMNTGEDYVDISLDIIKDDFEAYGGRVIGKVRDYNRVALPESLVSGAIEVPLSQVPRGEVPLLLNSMQALNLAERGCPQYFTGVEKAERFYRDVRESVIGRSFDMDDSSYYVVGLAADGMCNSSLSFQSIDRNNTSVLNPVLKMFHAPDGTSLIVQSGESDGEGDGEVTGLIAVFDTSERAYEYLTQGHGGFFNLDLPGKDVQYDVRVAAGMSPEVMFVFQAVHCMLDIACIVLAVIAAIIVIFTSIRLIDQDKQTIKLYHALGATTGQVKLVYGCYLLELMCGAAIMAFVVASLITILYSVINQVNLTVLFEMSFGLDSVSNVILWGMNWEIVGFCVVLLVMAPVGVLVNRRNF